MLWTMWDFFPFRPLMTVNCVRNKWIWPENYRNKLCTVMCVGSNKSLDPCYYQMVTYISTDSISFIISDPPLIIFWQGIPPLIQSSQSRVTNTSRVPIFFQFHAKVKSVLFRIFFWIDKHEIVLLFASNEDRLYFLKKNKNLNIFL